MDRAVVTETVAKLWQGPVLTGLSELVEIPAVSAGFDADWAANGHLHRAIEHLQNWIAARELTGARLEVVELADRSPLLLIDVPATDEESAKAGTALLYGHLDKQPPFDGWSEGLAPWTPVQRDGKLYGRGSVDDGYAGFAATAALEAIQKADGKHGRCVLMLETGEESGSPDLPAYLEHLSDRLGEVTLVVCLDAGGHDYRRIWLTTSLRGLVQVAVTVRVLQTAQHSGVASGIVASSMRVLRVLLDRLENSADGEILVSEMNVEVPQDRLAELRGTAEVAPTAARDSVNLAPGMRMNSEDPLELSLNASWRPTLSITGAAGLPQPADAGNVLRTDTTLCLSFRLPPTADSQACLAAVRKLLTTDIPYDATVELSRVEAADGWNAPQTAPWLAEALEDVSESVFDEGWRAMGMGGSIPFMGLLAQHYPSAQFIVTGALGPDSNMHVADESIDLAFAAKITEAVAVFLDAHGRSRSDSTT